jgi:hypothetical protein
MTCAAWPELRPGYRLLFLRRTGEHARGDHPQRWLLTDDAHSGRASGRQLLREVLAGPLSFAPDGRKYRFEGEASFDGVFAGMTGSRHLWCARADLNCRPPA